MPHKALFLQATHGTYNVGTTETLKPAPGDLLVKVLATALNPIDWKIREYGPSIFQKFDGVSINQYPIILGTDSAGVVEEVGEGVTAFKKGDEVFHQGLFFNDKATFQEYTTVPAEIVAKIPENITFDQAASIPLGLATAAIGFYDAPGRGAGLTPPWAAAGAGKYKGQGTLILGGSSSVGQYAIQLAHLSGFSPIVTTASLHNTDLLKSLGATHVIDRKADVVSEARKILQTAPSVVYDAISEDDTQQQGWKVLRSNGQLILVLPASSSINLGEDGKKVAVFFGNVHAQRDIGRSLYAKLTSLLESGKIRPNRVEVIPGGLAGVEAGLKRLQDNEVSGLKLVVRPQETA